MTNQTMRGSGLDSNSGIRKKLSSAASNVAQVKAKAVPMNGIDSIAQSRVTQGVNLENGEPTLTAIFPGKDGCKSHHLDISFLHEFPNLKQMFTDALVYWGSQLSAITRIEGANSLRRYFFAYLKSNCSTMLYPEDIDDEVLAGFKDNLLNKAGKRVKALHPTTVSAALSDLRMVLSSIHFGPWTNVAHQIAERVPCGPAGAHHKVEPTKILALDQLLEMITAAEKEVVAIEHRFTQTEKLLAVGRVRLDELKRISKDTSVDYRNFELCLAAVEQAYPGVIPSLSKIREAYPKLARAVQHFHGLNKIESYLYTRNRDLVPFVLLLSVVTLFNPETILSLNWQDIEFDKDRAGESAIEIIGSKDRAARDLVRLLDPNTSLSSSLSLIRMLECLREITLRMRPFVVAEDADCLFVYVGGILDKRAKGFGIASEKRILIRSKDPSWRSALRGFIKDNKLAPFNLNQIRPSILSMVQYIDGSLEVARKVGNHGSPVTTWTHYTSGAVRSRYRERIGQVLLLRDRWVQTAGDIDPRRLSRQQDMGAATPGFSCINPFESPRPGQHAGKLCKDYGGCPSCPMAAAHPGDPECVALYTALELAIYRSQATMSARTWIERWVPVLADLSALRNLIPPEVHKASLEISIQLPNVG